MSMLARTALRVPRQVAVRQQTRGLHFENTLGHTVPMNTDSKPKTAIKLGLYACAGFGLPFFACYHHLAKSSGST